MCNEKSLPAGQRSENAQNQQAITFTDDALESLIESALPELPDLLSSFRSSKDGGVELAFETCGPCILGRKVCIKWQWPRPKVRIRPC